MKSDELREWVEGPQHSHHHSFGRGYQCQDGNHGDSCAVAHESVQDAVICNLIEAVRLLMVRVERLEAPVGEPGEPHFHRPSAEPVETGEAVQPYADRVVDHGTGLPVDPELPPQA